MKKRAIALFIACIFVFALSANSFAEGDIPIGGRTCPATAPCLTDNQVSTGQSEKPTVFTTWLDYLTEIFG